MVQAGVPWSFQCFFFPVPICLERFRRFDASKKKNKNKTYTSSPHRTEKQELAPPGLFFPNWTPCLCRFHLPSLPSSLSPRSLSAPRPRGPRGPAEPQLLLQLPPLRTVAVARGGRDVYGLSHGPRSGWTGPVRPGEVDPVTGPKGLGISFIFLKKTEGWAKSHYSSMMFECFVFFLVQRPFWCGGEVSALDLEGGLTSEDGFAKGGRT